MTFKEQLAKDMDVFLNFNEFAEWRRFDDSKVLCILESNENQRRAYDKVSQFNDGLVEYDLTLIYKYRDFPHEATYNSLFNLDGVDYTVINFAVDEGIVTLKLQRIT